jgi:hypothetical protein
MHHEGGEGHEDREKSLTAKNLARQSRNQIESNERRRLTTKDPAQRAATKTKMDITTKRTKSTKAENIFLRFDPAFVSFATFVVRKSFVEWRIPAN